MVLYILGNLESNSTEKRYKTKRSGIIELVKKMSQYVLVPALKILPWTFLFIFINSAVHVRKPTKDVNLINSEAVALASSCIT